LTFIIPNGRNRRNTIRDINKIAAFAAILASDINKTTMIKDRLFIDHFHTDGFDNLNGEGFAEFHWDLDDRGSIAHPLSIRAGGPANRNEKVGVGVRYIILNH
jgi:hypothetical protein